jgi:hypothetical protein
MAQYFDQFSSYPRPLLINQMRNLPPKVGLQPTLSALQIPEPRSRVLSSFNTIPAKTASRLQRLLVSRKITLLPHEQE